MKNVFGCWYHNLILKAMILTAVHSSTHVCVHEHKSRFAGVARRSHRNDLFAIEITSKWENVPLPNR